MSIVDLPRVPMDEKLGSSREQWESTLAVDGSFKDFKYWECCKITTWQKNSSSSIIDSYAEKSATLINNLSCTWGWWRQSSEGLDSFPRRTALPSAPQGVASQVGFLVVFRKRQPQVHDSCTWQRIDSLIYCLHAEKSATLFKNQQIGSQ